MMKKWTFRVILIVCTLLISAASINSISLAQNSGAIWTTRGTCGSVKQDVNQYSTGDTVYINGDNFSAGEYSWSIVGQPGGASSDPGLTVASGSMTVDASGAFCFSAYTIPSGDSGEYKVNFATSKGDNYRVIELTLPTATDTIVPTFTNTPTLTSTHTVTPTGTLQPTVPPTETLVPTATEVQTSEPTSVPQKAPVTGSPANPALMQGAAAVFALISIGSLVLLKKKID